MEKDIKQWRKTLNKNSALEDGYKEELECHLRDKIEFLMNGGSSEEKAFKEAVQKIGEAHSLGSELQIIHPKKKRPPSMGTEPVDPRTYLELLKDRPQKNQKAKNLCFYQYCGPGRGAGLLHHHHPLCHQRALL